MSHIFFLYKIRKKGFLFCLHWKFIFKKCLCMMWHTFFICISHVVRRLSTPKMFFFYEELRRSTSSSLLNTSNHILLINFLFIYFFEYIINNKRETNLSRICQHTHINLFKPNFLCVFFSVLCCLWNYVRTFLLRKTLDFLFARLSLVMGALVRIQLQFDFLMIVKATLVSVIWTRFLEKCTTIFLISEYLLLFSALILVYRFFCRIRDDFVPTFFYKKLKQNWYRLNGVMSCKRKNVGEWNWFFLFIHYTQTIKTMFLLCKHGTKLTLIPFLAKKWHNLRSCLNWIVSNEVNQIFLYMYSIYKSLFAKR